MLPAAVIDNQVSSASCIVFSTTTCPYCIATKDLLRDIGADFTLVELDEDEDGGTAVREALAARTGRTSVPAVFVGGEFVGGANDGGLGGALTLHKQGKLAPLLREAGALGAGSMTDPIARMFSTLFAGGTRKKIYFGVFQTGVDPSEVPSDEERSRRRAQAAKDLTNIDMRERERRLLASQGFGAVTAVVAAALLGSHAAPLARLAIAPPLFLTYGFYASYQQGL